jgi:hypothetical protein
LEEITEYLKSWIKLKFTQFEQIKFVFKFIFCRKNLSIKEKIIKNSKNRLGEDLDIKTILKQTIYFQIMMGMFFTEQHKKVLNYS